MVKLKTRILKAIKEAEDKTLVYISDNFKEALIKELLKKFKKFEG